MATDRWIQVPQGWLDHFSSRSTSVGPANIWIYTRPYEGGALSRITDHEELLSCDDFAWSIDFEKFGGLGKGKDTSFVFTKKTDYFTTTLTKDQIGDDLVVYVRFGDADFDDGSFGMRTLFVGRITEIKYEEDSTVEITAHHHFEWSMDNEAPDDWYALTPDRYVSSPKTFKGRDPGQGNFILNDQIEDSERWEDADLTNYDANWPKTYSVWIEEDVNDWWYTDTSSGGPRICNREGNTPYAYTCVDDNRSLVVVKTQGHTISGTWDTDVQSGLNWFGAYHPFTSDPPYGTQTAYLNEIYYCITPPAIKYVDGTGQTPPLGLVNQGATALVSGGCSAWSGPSPSKGSRKPRGADVWKVHFQEDTPVGDGNDGVTHPIFLPDRIERPSLSEGNPISGARFNNWRLFGIRQAAGLNNNVCPHMGWDPGGNHSYSHHAYDYYPWKVKKENGAWVDDAHGWISYAATFMDLKEENQSLWPDVRQGPGDVATSWPSGDKDSPWLRVAYCPGQRWLTGISGMVWPGSAVVATRDEPCQLIYSVLSKVWRYGRPPTFDIDTGVSSGITGEDLFWPDGAHTLTTGSYDNSYSWVGQQYYQRDANRWPGSSKFQDQRGVRVGLTEADITPKEAWKKPIETLCRGLGFYVFSTPWGGVDVWCQNGSPGAGDNNWTFSADLSGDTPLPGDQTTRNVWGVEYDWHDWKVVEHVEYRYRALYEETIDLESPGFMPTGVINTESRSVKSSLTPTGFRTKPKRFGSGQGLVFDVGSDPDDTTWVQGISDDINALYGTLHSSISFSTTIDAFWDDSNEYFMRIGSGFYFTDAEAGVSGFYWVTGFSMNIIAGTMEISGVSAGAEPGVYDPVTDDPAPLTIPANIVMTAPVSTTVHSEGLLYNIGWGNLTGTTLISGDPEFSLDWGSGIYDLRHYETVRPVVAFTPTGVGTFTGYITFSGGDHGIIPINGTGWAPSPRGLTSIDFNPTDMGRGSQETWIVSNTSPSGSPALSSVVSLTNDSSKNAFSITSADKNKVPQYQMYVEAGSGTDSIEVSFWPTSSGVHTGTLWTDFPAPHNEITLSGMGVDPRADSAASTSSIFLLMGG